MIRAVAEFGARVLRAVARNLEKLGGTQRLVVERAMAAHDMHSHPDEAYYREQYWHWIVRELEKQYSQRNAKVLDIGCGQGRISLPLADWLSAGTVVGVDITEDTISKAREYAQARGISNAEFLHADALEYLRSVPDRSLDVALLLEVSFFMPSYREAIAEIARVLKKEGRFFVSFRSQHFDLLYSIKKRDWASARLVRDEREGNWGGGSTWFSWHTIQDIESLMHSAGFSVLEYRGIGIASGLGDDPLSVIARPSELAANDQAQLLDLEVSLAQQYAECGRYILVVAVKSADL